MKQLIVIILTILSINLWSTLSVAASQACRFVSEGSVQQSWKKIRIQNMNGDTLAGADSFSEALAIGQHLLNAQVCSPRVQDCRLASEGIVGGMWMKHRIQMDSDMVFGADDIATALSYLSELRRTGFCQ